MMNASSAAAAALAYSYNRSSRITNYTTLSHYQPTDVLTGSIVQRRVANGQDVFPYSQDFLQKKYLQEIGRNCSRVPDTFAGVSISDCVPVMETYQAPDMPTGAPGQTSQESYHQKYMQLAVDLSKQNIDRHLGGPFGCVIVRDNQVVSTGANSVVRTNDPTAHAEVVAVRNACQKLNTFDLTGCVLYTSCEPCPMCYGAIRWSRIDKIYYANTRTDADNIGFSDKEIYDELIQQKQLLMKMENPNAIKVFDQWKNDQKNVHY